MRVDVAYTPAALAPAALAGATALVVDVLRASTTIVAALTHGCLAMVPVGEVDEARERAVHVPGALLAGERGGDPPAGFDLGNSPLEFTPARVAGRTIVFTTSNGTRALLAARPAAVVGVAGLANLTAAAAAGPAAAAAAAAARVYAREPARLAADAPHARRLAAQGRAADVAACLTLDAFTLVPVYRADVDKVVSPYR